VTMQNWRSVQIAMLVVKKVMPILLWNGSLHLRREEEGGWKEKWIFSSGGV
jgi:hypothetical protein